MIDIRRFVPATTPREAWTACHMFHRRRAAEDGPGEPLESDAEYEHGACREWPLWESRRLLATRDGVVVGEAGGSFRRTGTEDHGVFAPYLHA